MHSWMYIVVTKFVTSKIMRLTISSLPTPHGMGNEVDMAEVLVSWLHSQGTVVLTFAWSLLVAAIVSCLIIAGKW